jgi:uncharacterized protein
MGYAADKPEAPLAFKAGVKGEYTFDTGVVRGKLRPDGKSLGLAEVMHIASGQRFDRGNGLFGYYRVFTTNHRYGGGAWDWPSTAQLDASGSVEVQWASAENRPFAMSAKYHWVASDVLEVETTVKANQDLPDFEVFLASYFDPAFTNSMVLAKAGTESGAREGFHAARKADGDWLMFPRESGNASMIQDGRWKIEPNPVDWKIMPEFTVPLGMRRNPQNGLAAVVMAPASDCYTVATPFETESHYSIYLSLFGRTVRAGETARTRARLWIAANPTTAQARERYDAMVSASSAAASVNVPAQTARVLLVTGQDYPGHPWRQTAPVLASMLERDARLKVTTIEDPHLMDSSALTNYDVILLHFMNWEQPAPGPAARENLRRAVEQGRGLMLVHFACGAFQDWPEFASLAGRAWDPKLRGHDPRGPFQVVYTKVEHPITRGLTPFEVDDELYTCLAGDRPISVLATAKSKVDSKDYPMAFVFNYGKGRVFHSPLGHDVKAIDNPGVGELFRRGCAWAAGLPLKP